MFKDFCIDLFIAGVKAQTQKKYFHELVLIVAPECGSAPAELAQAFEMRLSERSFGAENGVAVFDVRSSFVQRSVILLSVAESAIDFKASDGKPADIVACVISPRSETGVHLQKISWISRLLRDKSLCEALRSANDSDAMRVLFLPQSRAKTIAA